MGSESVPEFSQTRYSSGALFGAEAVIGNGGVILQTYGIPSPTGPELLPAMHRCLANIYGAEEAGIETRCP